MALRARSCGRLRQRSASVVPPALHILMPAPPLLFPLLPPAGQPPARLPDESGSAGAGPPGWNCSARSVAKVGSRHHGRHSSLSGGPRPPAHGPRGLGRGGGGSKLAERAAAAAACLFSGQGVFSVGIGMLPGRAIECSCNCKGSGKPRAGSKDIWSRASRRWGKSTLHPTTLWLPEFAASSSAFCCNLPVRSQL